MQNRFVIRLINESDAEAALGIYTPYVRDTAISFEYEVPTIEDYLNRIKSSIADFPWLVCELNGQIIGFAYAGKHRYRSAYQWSTESTIYFTPKYHGFGIARILYKTLFSILKLQGYINVYAGVGLPNENSVAFHRAMGFEEIGIFKKVGYKMGKWHNTLWFQLFLSENISQPDLPKRLNEILASEDFKKIMIESNECINKILNAEISNILQRNGK